MKEVTVQINGIWYIDPVHFLNFLKERVSLITERIAVPGVDLVTTEGLRGRRSELTTLIQQLAEETNGQ
jgi:hypothetical protein